MTHKQTSIDKYPFNSTNAKQLVKVGKLNIQDIDAFTLRMNDIYESYFGTHLLLSSFKNTLSHSIAKKKKTLENIIYSCNKLITALDSMDFSIASNIFDLYSETNRPDLLIEYLDNLAKKTQFYLNTAPKKDLGGAPTKDKAFHHLVLHLIKTYKQYSKLPASKFLWWDDIDEKYKGNLLPFIEKYLKLTKIKVPIKALPKFIQRKVSELKEIHLLDYRQPQI